jgi:hypothetical protein
VRQEVVYPDFAPNPTSSPITPLNAEELRKLIFQPPEKPGLKHTVAEGLTHPIDRAKGQLLGVVDTVKGLAHQGANAIQAITPFGIKVAGSTEPPQPDLFKTPPIEWGNNISLRLQRLGNAVLFGLPDTLEANRQKYIPQEPREITWDDQAMSYLKATGETAAMDVLPGRNAYYLLTGQGPDGKPLTAEEIGKLETTSVIQAAPFVKAWAGAAAPRLGAKPETFDVTRTSGEITAAAEAIREQARATREARAKAKAAQAAKPAAAATAAPAVAEGAEGVAAQVREALPREVVGDFDVTVRALEAPETTAIMAEVVQTDVFRRIAERNPEMKHSDVVAESIRQGALSPDSIRQIKDAHGLTLDEVADATASVLQDTATLHGKGLSPFSIGTLQALEEIALKAAKGDREAIRQFNALREMRNNANGPLANVSKAAGVIRKIESYRLASMVSQPATAMRNAFAQMGVGVTAFLDDFIAGTVEAVGGKLTGEKRSISSYYADALNDLVGVLDMFGDRRDVVTDILNNVPLLKHRLFQTAQYDVVANVLKDTATRGTKYSAAGDGVRNLLTGLNRIQEIEFRRLFFGQRLRANLERAGLKGEMRNGQWIDPIEQLREKMASPQLDPALRQALTDAEVFAMKQTFAYTPKDGFGAAVLDVYRKWPVMTAIAHPFPRFWLNQWRYLGEHNPAGWFEMFDPAFRAELAKGAEGGFASKNAARALGRATTGAMMLAGAYGFVTSDERGAKYYQWKTPSGVMDLRSQQPFISYAAVAELANWAKGGFKDLNLTPNELADMAVGLRNLREVPILGLPEIADALATGNPENIKRAVMKYPGLYLASFLVPGRTVQDLYHAATGTPQVVRDVEGQELVGPVLANVAPAVLPARIDPTTSTPMVNDRPGLKQLTGATFDKPTKFADLIVATPGLKMSDLVGDQATPEGTREVQKAMGKVLSIPFTTNKTLGDALADALQRMNLTPAMRKEFLSTEVFPELRAMAKELAKQTNKAAFIADEIQKDVPKPLQPAVMPKGAELYRLLTTPPSSSANPRR